MDCRNLCPSFFLISRIQLSEYASKVEAVNGIADSHVWVSIFAGKEGGIAVFRSHSHWLSDLAQGHPAFPLIGVLLSLTRHF